MRSGGYKCYNYQCSGRVGNSILCGEPGESALHCVDRVFSPATNADHIRGMSDEGLVEVLKKPFCDRRTIAECVASGGNCDACILNWLRQPWEEV